MTSVERIVIVGGGLAAAKAAESLRANGYDGGITLLGEEPEAPYTRPPLSKGYLRGEKERDSFRVHPEAFYADGRIDLQRGVRVEAIEPAARQVSLADGRRLGFDRLLLATGASPRTLDVPGADLPGVLTLRTLADADRLREALGAAEQIAVVGAGWIGSEVAASLRTLGRAVTLIAPRAPLEGVVGPEIAALMADVHRDRGVDLRTGARVVALTGRDHVRAVELDGGESVAADLVVVSIGVAPRTELARHAGLAVSDGIEVNALLETSVAGIFAAGDVAAAWHPFFERRIRTEHLSNARLQGTAVASSLLGATQPFDAIPSFFSEQHGIKIEVVGHGTTAGRLVVRGNLADRSLIGFRLVDDRVVAGIGINGGEEMQALPALVRAGAAIDPATLADASLPLQAIVDGAARKAVETADRS